MVWRKSAMLCAAMVVAIGAAGATQQVPDRIFEKIRQAEYEFSAHGSAYVAPNRAQGFRSRLDPRGLDVTDRMKGDDAWRLHMSLSAWGREGAVQPAVAPEISAKGARVELSRPGLKEWFVSSPEGLEHGFEIEAHPEAGDAGQPLVLDLAVEGSLRAGTAGSGIVFKGQAGAPELRYDHLRVADARGTSVPASLGVHGRGIRIRIDDNLVVYPLTVDPLLTSPSTTIDESDPNGHFGFSVAGGCDLDGDGYDDLVVGAPNYDDGTYTDGGRVFVFFGSSSGPDTDSEDFWTADGDHDDSLFGYSVAGAGDVNADGIGDLVIGAPQHDEDDENFEGFAFVWYGPLDHGDAVSALNADWRAHSNKANSDFGYSVSGAGDVDNDGDDEIIVGSPKYQNNSNDNNEGWAFVWYGDPNDGLGTQVGTPTNADWSAQSQQSGAKLGWSVAGAGDVDDDGYDDVMAGAPYYDGSTHNNQGRVFVWLGTGSGINGGTNGTAKNAEWKIKATSSGSLLGWSLASGVDVDGDGTGDVLAGAPGYGSGGSAFLWAGSSGTGLGNSPNLDEDDAAWRLDSGVSSADLGSSVARAGNVQCNGVDSVLIGAPAYNGGAVFVYHGCPDVGLTTGTADQELDPADPGAVAGGCDFDDDGYDDIAIGLPNADPNSVTDAGEVLVYRGSDDTPDVTVVSPNGGETLVIGNSVTLEWTAENRCDDVPSVDILLSRNGSGGPFTALFTGLENTGSQSWTVTGSESTQAVLKVVAEGPCGTTDEDLSDSTFWIDSGQCVMCARSYCEDEGVKCTFADDCSGGCCHYTCDADPSCEAPDQKPANAC